MAAREEAAKTDRKRILALDGGGIRGAFSIEILARMEELLRKELGRPQLVLADHFQFIAGTSTGAIIATLLSWGETVDGVRELYHKRCAKIFPKHAPWKIWKLPLALRSLYSADALSSFLKSYFHDEATGNSALLGTAKLRTMLLVCMRNATTGAAWPVTNNPKSKYNARELAHCNLNIPLWKLVRGSTAAPVYFAPEEIEMGKLNFAFVDGGATPYNTPAFIAYLMATLPCYRLEWPASVDKLLLVSVGTGNVRTTRAGNSLRHANVGSDLLQFSSGLMESISQQQDFLCRVTGLCVFGEKIDSEIGDLLSSQREGEDRRFTYVRYNHHFSAEELAEKAASLGKVSLSNVNWMPYLRKLGERYAGENVKIEHLL